MDTAEQLIETGRRRLRRQAERFNRRGDERIQARELLETAIGGSFYEDDEIDAHTKRLFERLIERREQGEPVGYIRGFEEFFGMRLAVRPGAFIPRQSSEFLATQAIRRLRGRRDPVAADLATGVGAVALAIASEVPGATVYGTDISKVAVSLARENARENGLSNAHFLEGSMFEPLPRRLRGAMDVIASHPPYVATHELGDLPAEMEFEPRESLTDSSPDGLGLLRVLVGGAREWLKPGGWVCVELASDLTRGVRSMLLRAGYRDVQSTRMSPWESRVLVARWIPRSPNGLNGRTRRANGERAGKPLAGSEAEMLVRSVRARSLRARNSLARQRG